MENISRMKRQSIDYWTHPSVLSFAGAEDPVKLINRKAKEIVMRAMQNGWSGPPFNPRNLADILHIDLVPCSDVVDARIALINNKYCIQFNPNRPKSRINFSIAHEIAHTLFNDCRDYIRERKDRALSSAYDWQLEMLCNIAAAEYLMPIGSFLNLKDQSLNIDDLMKIKDMYEVSAEALLLRIIKLTDEPSFVFFSSRAIGEANYRIDYSLGSRTNYKNPTLSGVRLSKFSCVNECSAIGYTSKGDEHLPGLDQLCHIESVGLPPYPEQIHPRVGSIVRPVDAKLVQTNSILYLKGDATKPRGPGKKIVAFIINDKGLSWGAGFARVIQTEWPDVQREFKRWALESRANLSLGNVHISQADENVKIFKMIAQHGYGPSPKPRIRYTALEECLKKLRDESKKWNATVHMPRIGSGQAGGSWNVISELIDDLLCAHGVQVTVYDLPNKKYRVEESVLDFFAQN